MKGRAEGDIVNCESVLGKMGSLSVCSYSPHSMRAIHYVPLGPPLQPAGVADRRQVHQEPPTIARRSQPGAGNPPLSHGTRQESSRYEGRANHRGHPYQPTGDLIRMECISDRRLTQSLWHVVTRYYYGRDPENRQTLSYSPPGGLVDRRHRLCGQRGDFLAGLRHEGRSLDSGRRKKPGGGLEGDAGLLDLQGPADQGSGDAEAVFREG